MCGLVRMLGRRNGRIRCCTVSFAMSHASLRLKSAFAFFCAPSYTLCRFRGVRSPSLGYLLQVVVGGLAPPVGRPKALWFPFWFPAVFGDVNQPLYFEDHSTDYHADTDGHHRVPAMVLKVLGMLRRTEVRCRRGNGRDTADCLSPRFPRPSTSRTVSLWRRQSSRPSLKTNCTWIQPTSAR